MNPVPAMSVLPDSIPAYGRNLIASEVEHLRPKAEILARFRELTRDHLAAVALAFVADIDADLESLATDGPESDPRGRVHAVRRPCEKRHWFLAYAGKPQTLKEAREHRATATLRAQVLNSPLVTPGQVEYGLAGLVRSWGDVELGAESREVLAGAVEWAAVTLRSHLMTSSEEYPRYLRLRAQLPAAQAGAEFEGEGSMGAARLAALCGELADARSRAEADANRTIAGLKARVGGGDLGAYVEFLALFGAASRDHPHPYPKSRLLDALVADGPEKFVPMEADWPPPPETDRPAVAPETPVDWARVGPKPSKRREHGRVD